MHRRLDDGIFGFLGHLDFHAYGAGVHCALEAWGVVLGWGIGEEGEEGRGEERGEGRTSSIPSSKEFFRIRLSTITWSAEGFGHCEIDVEIISIDTIISINISSNTNPRPFHQHRSSSIPASQIPKFQQKEYLHHKKGRGKNVLSSPSTNNLSMRRVQNWSFRCI